MSDPLNDTPEYLEQWASELRHGLTLDDYRLLIRMYRGNAANRRLPEQDRKFARRRATALNKRL